MSETEINTGKQDMEVNLFHAMRGHKPVGKNDGFIQFGFFKMIFHIDIQIQNEEKRSVSPGRSIQLNGVTFMLFQCRRTNGLNEPVY